MTIPKKIIVVIDEAYIEYACYRGHKSALDLIKEYDPKGMALKWLSLSNQVSENGKYDLQLFISSLSSEAIFKTNDFLGGGK